MLFCSVPFATQGFSDTGVSTGVFTREHWREVAIVNPETWTAVSPVGTETWTTMAPSDNESWLDISTRII